MKWNDLKQLEALLLKTEKQGTIIKEIGKSGQQKPIYSVTVGDKNPDRDSVTQRNISLGWVKA